MRSPQPSRSKISSVRLAKQMAREPVESLLSLSSSTTRDLALRQVDRQRQADRAGADHHDRVAHRLRGVLVRMAGVVEDELLVVDVGSLARRKFVELHGHVSGWRRLER